GQRAVEDLEGGRYAAVFEVLQPKVLAGQLCGPAGPFGGGPGANKSGQGTEHWGRHLGVGSRTPFVGARRVHPVWTLPGDLSGAWRNGQGEVITNAGRSPSPGAWRNGHGEVITNA